MSATEISEPSCPGCKQPLVRKPALGLRPPELAPGEFTNCARCGSVLVVNADRTLRFAAQEEIEDEIRLYPFFHSIVRAAERRRREFLARKSGFATPAALKRALSARGGQ